MKFSSFILVIVMFGCGYAPNPNPVYDSGTASCRDANANAGHCEGLVAPGGDEDAGTVDDVPFIEWCRDALFLDRACIAAARNCDEAVRCLEN